jgi:2-hydroxycyclohexanecarboxyl-CoA dehydrogenase
MFSRVALVTGGGGAIGRAAAVALARQGIAVAVADVSLEGMELTRQQALAYETEILCIRTDVRERDSVNNFVQAATDRFGHVDILVNCAGIFPFTHVANMDEDEWDRVIEINLKGAFLCSQTVLRSMRKQGWGRIVIIGSARGTEGYAGGAHYAASKGGLIGLMKSLALETRNEGITVNIINPGMTDTPMLRRHLTNEQIELFQQQSGSRLGQPEDITGLLSYLVSEEAGHVTGQVYTLRFP